METNLNYDMYVPTRVLFGAGMLNKLGEQPMPGKKALIIISNGNRPALTDTLNVPNSSYGWPVLNPFSLMAYPPILP